MCKFLVEKVLGVLKVLRVIGWFCWEIDKSTISGNESTFLGIKSTFLGIKTTWFRSNLKKQHFLLTGSWVGVLSVVSRSSVGEIRQGIREGKEVAILRKRTFLSKNIFFSKKNCLKYAGYRPPFNELLYLHRRNGLVVRNLPCKLGRPPLLLFPQIKNLREPYFSACWHIPISLCSNEFSNIPPKLRSLNAAHVHFFYPKMHFFLKKFAHVHFL